MPDGVNISDDLDEELERMVHDFRNASEGDTVLWGDRRDPLTVLSTGEDDGDRFVVVEGPQGGTYRLRENYAENGVPNYRTNHGHDVEAFHIVTHADPEDTASPTTNPGGSASNSTFSDSVSPADLDSFSVDRTNGDLSVTASANDDRAELLFTSSRGMWNLDGDRSDFSDAAGSEPEITAAVENRLLRRGWNVNPALGDRSLYRDEGIPMSDDAVDRLRESPDYDAESAARRREEGWTAAAPGRATRAGAYLASLTGFAATSWDDLKPWETRSTLRQYIERVPLIGQQVVTKFWTFVDELTNLYGVDVPKAYNEWTLYDHGIITGADEDIRQLGWLNRETGEVIVALAERVPDEPPMWGIYRFNGEENDAVATDGGMARPVTPDHTVTDGGPVERANTAMGTVQDEMGADDDLDMEVVEDTDGSATIRENIDPVGLGRNVIESAWDATTSLGASARTSAADAREWTEENYDSVGRISLATAISMISFGLERASDVYLRPVIRRGESGYITEFGVKLGAKYSSSDRAFESGVGEHATFRFESPGVDMPESTREYTVDMSSLVWGMGKSLHTAAAATAAYMAIDVADRWVGLQNVRLTLPNSGDTVAGYRDDLLERVLTEEEYETWRQSSGRSRGRSSGSSSGGMTRADSATGRAVAAVMGDLGGEAAQRGEPDESEQRAEASKFNFLIGGDRNPDSWSGSVQTELAHHITENNGNEPIGTDINDVRDAIFAHAVGTISTTLKNRGIPDEGVSKGDIGGLIANDWRDEGAYEVVEHYYPQLVDDQGKNAFTNGGRYDPPDVFSTQMVYDAVAATAVEEGWSDNPDEDFPERSTRPPASDDEPSENDLVEPGNPNDEAAERVSNAAQFAGMDETEAEAYREAIQEEQMQMFRDYSNMDPETMSEQQDPDSMDRLP